GLAVLVAALGTGCAGPGSANLVARGMSVSWHEKAHTASATVVNTGAAGAGAFIVSFRAIVGGASSTGSPHLDVAVGGLAAGAKTTVGVDFAPPGMLPNHDLAAVNKITVLVDASHRVTESDETDNSLETKVKGPNGSN